MVFKLMADCEFHANDLDDAFVALAMHFLSLNLSLNQGEDSRLILSGKIEINPMKET